MMESHKQMTLQDWLDDLCVRFIINLPQEDLSSVARICFQVEEAQWFYEDFIRPLDPRLPSMSLRFFCLKMFQHCPLLASFSTENHIQAFEEFMQYKTRVPVRGAIMLNKEMDSVVLVKGWKKSASWSFPRGKINKSEGDLDCAIREVEEETGFNLRTAGLIPHEEAFYIDIPIREQQLRLYVFRDIPMDTQFQPLTRKEISKVQWYKLSELPAFRKKGGNHTYAQEEAAAALKANKFYMVAPFLVRLKKWVVQQKKRDANAAAHASTTGSISNQLLKAAGAEEAVTEDDVGDQTEPPIAPKSEADAARIANSLEDTTRELHRLLNIQSPELGVQIPAPSSQPRSKGASLLALLQTKNRASEQEKPQTPFDQFVAQVPQPPSPHRHNHSTKLGQIAAQKPPPQFSVASGAAVSAPWDPAVQHEAANSRQPHINNSNMNFLRQLTSQPLLAHPQPLPPVVHSEMLQAAHRLEKSGDQAAPSVARKSYTSGISGAPPPFPQPTQQQSSQQPSQRNGHGHHRVDPHSAVQSSANQPENVRQHPQFIQATSMEALGAGDPQGQFPQRSDAVRGAPWPGAMVPGQHPEGLNHLKPAAPPTDKHRTALLGMFKRTDNGPGTTASSVPPFSQIGMSYGQSAAQITQPPSHHMQQHNASNTPPATGDSGHRVQYDLLSMLQHPNSGRSGHGNQELKQPRLVSQPSRFSVGPPFAGPAGQVLAVKSPNLAPSLGAIYGKSGQGNPSAWASPPATSAFPTPGLLPSSSGASSEHRQKLLSLFGKPQRTSPDAGGLGGMPSVMGNRSQINVKSRLGSVSTILGDEGKYQAPISPAEKDFLLEYLTTMTNESKAR